MYTAYHISFDVFVQYSHSVKTCNNFSRPYSSNGRVIGMIVVRLSPICLSVTDVLWLNNKS